MTSVLISAYSQGWVSLSFIMSISVAGREMRLILHFEGQILLPQHSDAETDCYLMNTAKLVRSENVTWMQEKHCHGFTLQYWASEVIMQSFWASWKEKLHAVTEEWDYHTEQACITVLI